jgi:glycogen debranching enzyme
VIVMEDVIRLHDQYYILATSSRAHERTRVLKHGDTFAIFDDFGDIVSFGLGEQGLYHDGTRYLSRLELRVNGARPLLLSSAVRDNNDLFVIDLTNPDIPLAADAVFRRDILHVFRSKFLWESACYERVRLANHGLEPVTLSITMRFDADFVDIFEVRGTVRPGRGRLLQPRVEGSALVLAYHGLDGTVRQTSIDCSPTPSWVGPDEAVFTISLPPQACETICCTVKCNASVARVDGRTYDDAFGALRASLAAASTHRARIETGNAQFNEWIGRSTADLQMMLSTTAHGVYPYAGVPWFSTPFGRDGIITALELLWLDPDVARGVLGYLAATQASEVNRAQDAEPGKILHETRGGEMAALGEIPFGRYYGSVDSTPLFVLLAGAYYERTGDRAFIESIWPNIEAALRWIDTYGDQDGDGFVEYMRHTPDGLVQQGWKDSQDSVFHADGALAEPPIALCEVQAYVYLAKRRASELSIAIGRSELGARLASQAERLRERFESAFWSDDLSAYVIALDGKKRPCQVLSSNAGHCLFGGIASRERAERIARALTDESMFSGWGVRTLNAREVRYNPMSYHNGSVWPHDNALVARGFSSYGLTEAAAIVFRGMFDLSVFVDQHRIPELVCGFHRRPGEAPTLYPVACAPQSWAAATVFMLLQSSLGISIHAPQRQIVLEHSLLPDFLPWVKILNLRVGSAVVDLLLERHEFDVGIQVLRRSGDLQIVSVR